MCLRARPCSICIDVDTDTPCGMFDGIVFPYNRRRQCFRRSHENPRTDDTLEGWMFFSPSLRSGRQCTSCLSRTCNCVQITLVERAGRMWEVPCFRAFSWGISMKSQTSRENILQSDSDRRRFLLTFGLHAFCVVFNSFLRLSCKLSRQRAPKCFPTACNPPSNQCQSGHIFSPTAQFANKTVLCFPHKAPPEGGPEFPFYNINKRAATSSSPLRSCWL